MSYLTNRRYGGYSPVSLTERLAGEGSQRAEVNNNLGVRQRTPVGAITRPVGAAIEAQRLTPFHASAASTNDPELLRRIPHASYTPGMYGDMSITPIILAANTSLLALSRPRNTRIYLMIQNTLAANILYAQFGNQADINAVQIQPGGNWLFDAVVPQNDLYLFSAAAGTVLVAYVNADIEGAVVAPE